MIYLYYDKLVTISEAAKVLGVSTSTLRRLETENGIVEGYGLKVIYTPGGQRRYIFDEIQQLYTNQGFSGKIGFGEKPALLIRDFTNAFFEPHSTFSIQINDQVNMTNELIAMAAKINMPVIFSKTIYDPDIKSSRLWCTKFPSLEILKKDSYWTTTLPELNKFDFDLISHTPYITSLYKSSVTSYLNERKIDTLILAGVTTSGSIRATAVEGLQQGYKVIIAKEAVGDRNKSLNASSLIDMNARYTDVMSVKEIISHFTQSTSLA